MEILIISIGILLVLTFILIALLFKGIADVGSGRIKTIFQKIAEWLFVGAGASLVIVAITVLFKTWKEVLIGL